MEQSSLNWVFGVANLILGAALKWVYDSHRDLRKADEKLTEKVNKIEVVVAGEYVKKDDFDKIANTIFLKLDKISEKLDLKADK